MSLFKVSKPLPRLPSEDPGIPMDTVKSDSLRRLATPKSARPSSPQEHKSPDRSDTRREDSPGQRRDSKHSRAVAKKTTKSGYEAVPNTDDDEHLCILVILVLLPLLSRAASSGGDGEDPDDIFGNWGRPETGTQGLAWYPTDFLRDVVPVACHSHNDYWRTVPLFSALHIGCIGVEADVWLYRDDLLIGHDVAALQPNRTFRSLYVDPLVDILERQNPQTAFYNESRRGVFDTDPEQTLVLLVDVKTEGAAAFRKVREQLEPLRSRGWLSTFHEGKVTYGPITVVGTGETPFDVVVENSTHRDAFYDAPLDGLEGSQFDRTNSYYASASLGSALGRVWFGDLRPGQLTKMRAHLKEAHDRGLKARYWELPAWPISIRNRVWSTLIREGVDLLNVDDIKAAAKTDWSKGGWI